MEVITTAKPLRVIVAGSRSFDDYAKLCRVLNKFRTVIPISEIVSGTARGADELGERYAKEYGIPVKRFPADWDRFGKRAGYLRNEQMADYGEALIAFWDGSSKGTSHMVQLALNKGLKVYIH